MSLHRLLNEAGVEPVSTSGRTYPCPVCSTGPGQYQHGDRRGPLRVFKARNGGEAWKCHACGAGGGAVALARALDRTDLVTLATMRSSENAPRPVSNRIDVRRAWADLQAGRNAWEASCAASLASWAAPDLARSWAASSAGIGWADVDAVEGRQGKALARWGRGVERHLLVALRDKSGDVRSAVARYHDAPPAGGPRFLFLSSGRAGVADGETLTYGSIPAAVAADGPIYLVEGARDWIVAHAWAQRSGGAAVGARSHGELPAVAALLADALDRQKRPSSQTEIRIVPHLGDHDEVGLVSARKAADVLQSRGCGTVKAVYCPPGRAGKADLADQVTGLSTAAESWARLDGLRVDLVAEAPIDIRDRRASEVLRDRIGRIAKAAQADPRALYVVEVPEAMGKTRACVEILACVAQDGGAGVLYQNTHERLDEARGELARLVNAGVAPDVPVTHLQGKARLCSAAARLESSGDLQGARDLRSRLSADRSGRMCMGCPLRQTCPATRSQGVTSGRITLATHERMRRGLDVPHTRVDALQVIDEAADLVTQDEVTRDSVIGILTAESPHSAAWRSANEEGVEAVRRIVGCLDALARRHAQPWAVTLDARTVISELDQTGATGPAQVLFTPRQTSLFEPVADVVDCQVEAPPDAPAWAVRAGRWRGQYVDRAAWSAVVDVARALARRTGSRHAMTVNADGSWSIVTMRAGRIPAGPAVLLDATATENRVRLEALARASGRYLQVERIAARVLSPGRSVHLRTGGFGRSRILQHGAPAPHAYGLVRRVLLDAAQSMPGGGKVGIITFKALATALDDPGHELGELRAWARASLDLDLVIGWYGRDDTGTNRFADCDALLLLGDPTGNMSAAAAQARLAGADPVAWWSSQTQAKARQACARGRSARRGDSLKLLMYVGRSAPMVPGVTWEVADLDRGRIVSDDRVEAVRRLRMLADAHGAIAAPVVGRLPALDGFGPQRVREMCAEVARLMGWAQHHVKAGRARWAVYAATREAAEVYASTMSSQNGLGVESAGIVESPSMVVRVFGSVDAPADAPADDQAKVRTVLSSMGIPGGLYSPNGLRRYGPPAGHPAPVGRPGIRPPPMGRSAEVTA
jgi:hypothetical protein